MPKDEFDPEDPHALVGVSVPVAPEEAAAAEEALARGLVEELVRLGFDEARVIAVFRTPYYAGAHDVLRARGEEAIRRLVREAEARYRPLAGGGLR